MQPTFLCPVGLPGWVLAMLGGRFASFLWDPLLGSALVAGAMLLRVAPDPPALCCGV
jgi:hypothetical protein